MWTAGLSTVPSAGFSGRSSFSGPLPWRMLLPGACSSLGWSKFSQRLYITGTLLLAIMVPIRCLFYFNGLREPKWKIISILDVFLGVFS
jgi:hypothetical protein